MLDLYLTASAALAAMSDLENSKNCNCKDQPQEPETTCDVVLAAERQKCEEEKKGLYWLCVHFTTALISKVFYILIS